MNRSDKDITSRNQQKQSYHQGTMILLTSTENDNDVVGTRNHSPTGNDRSPYTITKLKLSPDSVLDIQETATRTALLDISLVPISRTPSPPPSTTKKSSASTSSTKKEPPRFNLPPIHTPLNHHRPPPCPLSVARRQQSSNSNVPPPPMIPPVPKPTPFGRSTTASATPTTETTTARRVQSDMIHQRGGRNNNNKNGTNDRRSIFGMYFTDRTKGTTNPESRTPYSAYGTNSMHPRDMMSNSGTITTSRRSTSPLPQSPLPPLSATQQQQQQNQNKRSSSGSILETAALHHLYYEPIDYRMFAPSPQYASKSAICGRFSSLEEVGVDVSKDLQKKSLPPLPSPLRRFCSEPSVRVGGAGAGIPNNMLGMYPLVTPTSILKQSSYSKSSPTVGENENKVTAQQQWRGGIRQSDSFNLTGSRRLSSQSNKDNNNSIDEATASESNILTEDASSLSVRFDPRVTVTEFEDPVKRSWYDEYELERLKRETIILAQKYLSTHPMEAEKYNRAKLDLVTGTFRKRALFSLPVLSSSSFAGSEGGKPDSTMGLPGGGGMSSKEYQELAKNQVRRILIVDPNPAIVTLFCKSMISMFPSAEMVTAQSAERALQLVKDGLLLDGSDEGKNNNDDDANNNSNTNLSSSSSSTEYEQRRNAFDIIIIEQSLYPYSPMLAATRKREPLCVGNTVAETATSVAKPSTGGDSPQVTSCGGGSSDGAIGGTTATGMVSNYSMPDFSVHATKTGPPTSRPTFRELNKADSFFRQPQGGGLPSSMMIRKDFIYARQPLCGADLIHSILLLEQETTTTTTTMSSSSVVSSAAKVLTSSSSPQLFQWKALVIGVSMYPDHDAKVLQQAGADVIWGKPIPRVGNALRNQLLTSLVAKRGGG